MLQHSLDFLKNQRQRLPGNVDDGIKGDDSGQAVVGNLERHHVSFAKRNVGIQLACLLYHAWRKVEAKNRCTGLMQESRDVTRAAAYVAYLAAAGSRAGKTLEQFAIERFVLEFVGDSAGVFFGEAIVTFANCFGEEVGHGIGLKSPSQHGLLEDAVVQFFSAPVGGRLHKGENQRMRFSGLRGKLRLK